MKKLRTAVASVLVLSLALLTALPCHGQTARKQGRSLRPLSQEMSLPRAAPEAIGMSSERLARISSTVQRSVSEGRIAGAVTLVLRRGKIAHLEAVGNMDDGKPMRTDTIFRIASMTKAVTSVAVMMLFEEGKILLGDPDSKYIPEFKGSQVAVLGEDKKSFTLVPAKRPISIRDLLTHTSGITYRFVGVEPWAKLYKDSAISDGLIETEGSLADNVKRLAGLPLMHHPGERFTYGLSTDVLGYLVEVVSGMTLDEFFRKRIFEPLKMKDTHFFLPGDKLSRLAAVYNQTPDGRIKRMGGEPDERGYLIYSSTFHYKGPKSYYSGGAGLVSTINDYARFLQTLLNGGELDGARILSRKSVELMTVNHVGELFGGQGFGLGFSVIRDLGKGSEPGSVGQYGWGGFYYTNFFVDPREKIIGLFMSQLYPSGNVGLHERFRALAYQAIID